MAPMSLNIILPSERMEIHNRALTTGLQPRQMFMCGAFGLHLERGREGQYVWRVTHVASGLFLRDFAEFADAVYAAGVLMGTGFDWSTVRTEEDARALNGSPDWRAVSVTLNRLCGHLIVGV